MGIFPLIKPDTPTDRKVLILLAVGLACLLYFTGSMDHLLVNVGLNFHDCYRNGFGATFCGDEYTQYKERLGLP